MNAHHERVARQAMIPTGDGLEPIPMLRYDGDGAFSVTFNKQNFGSLFGLADTQNLGRVLVERWRDANDPAAAGNRVWTIQANPGGYSDRLRSDFPATWTARSGNLQQLLDSEEAAIAFVRDRASRVEPAARAPGS
jgi:hypothetical protein